MLHTCYRAHAGLRIPPADHTRPCSAARHPSCGPPASTPSGKPGLPNARPSAPDLGVAHGHHLPWRLPRSPKQEPTFQARCAIKPPTTDPVILFRDQVGQLVAREQAVRIALRRTGKEHVVLPALIGVFRVAAAVKEAPVIGIERAIPTLAWTLALVGQAVVEQVLLEARKALDQVWRLAPQVPFVIHENQNLLDGCVFPDEGDQVGSFQPTYPGAGHVTP